MTIPTGISAGSPGGHAAGPTGSAAPGAIDGEQSGEQGGLFAVLLASVLPETTGGFALQQSFRPATPEDTQTATDQGGLVDTGESGELPFGQTAPQDVDIPERRLGTRLPADPTQPAGTSAGAPYAAELPRTVNPGQATSSFLDAAGEASILKDQGQPHLTVADQIETERGAQPRTELPVQATATPAPALSNLNSTPTEPAATGGFTPTALPDGDTGQGVQNGAGRGLPQQVSANSDIALNLPEIAGNLPGRSVPNKNSGTDFEGLAGSRKGDLAQISRQEHIAAPGKNNPDQTIDLSDGLTKEPGTLLAGKRPALVSDDIPPPPIPGAGAGQKPQLVPGGDILQRGLNDQFQTAHLSPDTAQNSLQFRVVGAGSDGGVPQLPVNAVAVRIARQAGQGATRFQIRLDPPELGRVDVKLELTSDGRVATHLTVERPETLDMFQREARTLERALANAGLRSDDGDLTFSLKNQGRDQNFGNHEPDRQHQFGGRAAEDPTVPADEDIGLHADNRTTLMATSGLDLRV